jgi:conjugal transfer pilus assembly protein TrbC
MPSDAELRSAPVPNRPNVEALPQPLSRTPIDLEALARGYASQSDAMTQAQGLATGPGLLVFVSLSMPRPTLQRLVDQAARAKATIVLRGFANGSLRDTVAQVQGLIGPPGGRADRSAGLRPLRRQQGTDLRLVRDGTRPLPAPAAVARPPTVSCGPPVT